MNEDQNNVVINDLTQLQEVTVDFEKCYVDNLEVIHQYALHDIESALLPRPLDVVLNLRSLLFTKAQELFNEELSEKNLRRRIVVHTAANDVVHLGYSLVNKSIAREIEKFCVAKSPTPDLAVIDLQVEEVKSLADLITVVAELHKTVKALQASVKSLTEENDSLQDRVIELEGQIPNDPSPESIAVTNNQTPNDPPPGGVNTTPAAETDSHDEPNRLQPAQINGQSQPAIQASATVSVRAPNPASNPAVNSQPDRSTDPGQAEVSDQGGPFEQQRSERRRQQRQTRQGLRAASHSPGASKQIYIGNVDSNCTPKDVSDHLTSKNIVVSSSDVRQLGNGGDSKSFCVTVPEEKFESLLSSASTLLPKNLKVRQFHPRKKSPRSNNKQPRRQYTQSRQAPHRGLRAQRHRAQTHGHSRTTHFNDYESWESPRAHHRDSDNNQSWYQRYDIDYDSDYDREWPRLPSYHDQNCDHYGWY